MRKISETHLKYVKGIKEIINLNLQSKNVPNSLKISDSIVNDKNIVVNEFNDFFNSIALKIDTKIIKTGSKFYETLKNPNEKTFFLNQATKEDSKTT